MPALSEERDWLVMVFAANEGRWLPRHLLIDDLLHVGDDGGAVGVRILRHKFVGVGYDLVDRIALVGDRQQLNRMLAVSAVVSCHQCRRGLGSDEI